MTYMSIGVDIDLRRRLRRMRLFVLVMIGATLAGFWDDVAPFVVTLNAIIWGCYFMTIGSQLHELRLADAEDKSLYRHTN